MYGSIMGHKNNYVAQRILLGDILLQFHESAVGPIKKIVGQGFLSLKKKKNCEL